MKSDLDHIPEAWAEKIQFPLLNKRFTGKEAPDKWVFLLDLIKDFLVEGKTFPEDKLVAQFKSHIETGKPAL